MRAYLLFKSAPLLAKLPRGVLLNSKYVPHPFSCACAVPFPYKEGGGNGEVSHYAHENGCVHIYYLKVPLRGRI